MALKKLKESKKGMMKHANMKKNIFKNDEGSIIITFALMLNVLILAIALSLDLGRGFMASAAISGAADSAAIASAVDEGNDETAEEYFLANLPIGTLGIEYDYADDVTHTVNTANNDVQVTATGFTIQAFFSDGANGSGFVPIGETAVVGLPASQPASADIIFVMDGSGSMGTSGGTVNGGNVTSYNPITIEYGQQVAKFKALEAAVLSFIDVLYEDGNPEADDGLPLFRISFKTYSNSLKFETSFQAGLEELVSNFPAAVNPGGGTNAGIGLQEARGEFEGNSPTERRKIVILLTDGDINRPSITDAPIPYTFAPDYTGATVGPGPEFKGQNNLGHEYTTSECYNIKQDPNVEFWSIGFGDLANQVPNGDVLLYCASNSDQYVQPTNGDELSEIFVNVANQISSVRIKE